MTSREQFEQWADRDGYPLQVDDMDNYRDDYTHGAWKAWQASRAVMKEGCARTAESVSPRHTECGNKIAAAIRAMKVE